MLKIYSLVQCAKEMRTMFVSCEKSVKKKFQKPNILRKKPKIVLKSNMIEAYESSDTTAVGTGLFPNEVHSEDPQFEASLNNHSQTNLVTQAERSEQNKNLMLIASTTSDHSCILNKNSMTDLANVELKRNQENANQASVNIDSFFRDATEEEVTLFGLDCTPGTSMEALLVIDNKSSVSSVFMEQNSDDINNILPSSAVSNTNPNMSQSETYSSSVQSFLSQITPVVKYKCGVSNCKKEFRSEQKFKKHLNIHGEDGSVKTPRQITVECPVKKFEADGIENPCGKIFLIRDELLKHLNEDHTLEDAVYRCEECGRRFFWASGLRAHARAHCRRAALAAGGASGRGGTSGTSGTGAQLVCGWAGCGRVFRVPCRLREHARAHTGDRPYPCDYPNCGWSFRSASKLMRHARRHTGERRHACALCGRAFLRAEHLREHTLRHAPRRLHACPVADCEQSFSNMSTLYMHMKKVHKKNENSPPATATSDTETFYSLQKSTWTMEDVNAEPETSFTENVSSESQLDDGVVLHDSASAELDAEDEAEAEAEAEVDAEDEWHSARTHCTWPLDNRVAGCDDGDANMLKDDSQMEQLEGSESNTYTVRSDLFLHGNVLINEDSEHMGGGVGGVGGVAGDEGSAGADSLTADLGLLDAHPTIDLMQEELMYADAAADESSFRIFLLSGEELT